MRQQPNQGLRLWTPNTWFPGRARAAAVPAACFDRGPRSGLRLACLTLLAGPQGQAKAQEAGVAAR
jgi:hypothetical protein